MFRLTWALKKAQTCHVLTKYKTRKSAISPHVGHLRLVCACVLAPNTDHKTPCVTIFVIIRHIYYDFHNAIWLVYMVKWCLTSVLPDTYFFASKILLLAKENNVRIFIEYGMFGLFEMLIFMRTQFFYLTFANYIS